MEIVRTDTPAELAGKKLEAAMVKNSELPVLLLLSGGSAFSILEHVDVDSFGSDVTISVLDERCSTDSGINNFAQLEATDFFKKAVAHGVKIIDTKFYEGDACGDLSLQFERGILKWQGSNENGVIIATMGIGPDGHTAGIIPGDYGANFSGEKLVVSYSVPAEVNPFTDRVTTTYTFLTTFVGEAVVFAVGADKHRIIAGLESNESILEKIPSVILTKMKSVTLFTDK